MAEVLRDGDELVVRLTALERAESLHGDLRLALDAVRRVEVLDHPVDAVGGWKVVGSRLSGHFAVGTFATSGGRCFAVVHRDTGRGVRVTLDGASFDELVVGCEDPEAVVDAIAPSG